MDKFNKTKYDNNYIKSNYTECKVRFRSCEAAILSKYSQNLGISKNALLQKCLVYCYNEMIDVSGVNLSTPDNSGKSQD